MSFQILSKLGTGNQGLVFHVKDKNNKEFAMKSITMSDVDSANQILKEFSYLKNLKNSNICQYFDIFMEFNETSGTTTINIIMEYCELGDLEQYLLANRNKLKEEDFINISLQIGRAVQYLHINNIVHRDIKPSNVFLTLDENKNLLVKLGDFGLSKQSQEGSLKKTICGTIHYIAPEVMEQKKYNGFYSDLFSLGALYFTILTGIERTFYIKFLTKEEDAVSDIQKDLEKSPSPYMNEVIFKIMRLDPLERISIENVVKLLENPIKDFINVQKLPFLFGDEYGIYEFQSGKIHMIYDFKNLLCNPSRYLFTNDRIIFLSRVPYLRFFSLKHSIKLENRSIFNDSSISQNICCNEKYVYISQGAFIKVFSIKSGKYITVLSAHKGLITSIDTDEDYVVSVSRDKKIRLWKATNKHNYDNFVLSEIEEHFNLIKINDKIVVGCSIESFHILGYNIQGKIIFTFKGHKSEITEILFYQDLLVSCSKDTTIRLLSTTTGNSYRVLNGHLDEVLSLNIVDDILMSGSKDNTIRFWNLKNGSCVGQINHSHPILSFKRTFKKFKPKTTLVNQKKCIGLIKCGHCKKYIIVCIHKDEKNGIPYCEPIDHLKSDDFCKEYTL